MTEQVRNIDAALIVPGDNDRTRFDADKLAELASSIETNGLAQPVTVRPIDGGRFEIVAGERRYRAITHVLGRDEVPCIVRELDDVTASAIMLAENLSRVDLDPVTEARAYRSRMEALNITPGQVAKMAGVSVAQVITRLPVLELVEEAQKLVVRGELSLNHARSMSDLDANRQRLVLVAHAKGLRYEEFAELCRKLALDQAEEGMQLFEMNVEEYVASTKSRRAPRARQVADLLVKMADAIEQAGSDPELVAEARDAVDRMRGRSGREQER